MKNVFKFHTVLIPILIEKKVHKRLVQNVYFSLFYSFFRMLQTFVPRIMSKRMFLRSKIFASVLKSSPIKKLERFVRIVSQKKIEK